MKRTSISICVFVLCVTAIMLFVACNHNPVVDTPHPTPTSTVNSEVVGGDSNAVLSSFDADDFFTPGITQDQTDKPVISASPDSTDVPTTPTQTSGTTSNTVISLADDGISIKGFGASADGSVLTINAAGMYEISGKLSAGQIVVNVPKEERVYLIFNGVNVTCKTNAPLYIMSCDKAVITLSDGTSNSFTDTNRYSGINSQGEPNACFFSKDDLTINGSGALTVNANYNNGITSKDDLKITGGIITVTAANHALRGNDSVMIGGGTIEVTAGKDGIKSSNIDEPQKGFVIIENGKIIINAYDDGIQAESYVTISGGKVRIIARSEKIKCATKNIADGCLT